MVFGEKRLGYVCETTRIENRGETTRGETTRGKRLGGETSCYHWHDEWPTSPFRLNKMADNESQDTGAHINFDILAEVEAICPILFVRSYLRQFSK